MADTVLETVDLGAQWPMIDPFLFCAHHADSLGAAARFGRGDVQWLTAGEGIVHSEMFPLLDAEQPNPLELFQIWLNLPPESKLVEPHFAMLWDGDIPRLRHTDDEGHVAEVTVIAGELAGLTPPSPPPHSWASRSDADVAVWHLRFEPGARWTLPRAAGADTVRTLYLFDGDGLVIDGAEVGPRTGAVVRVDVDVDLHSPAGCEVLVLQGRPIGEPVARYGPVRHEHRSGDRAGLRRLPGDPLRGVAVAVGGARAPAGIRPLRQAPRRDPGGAGRRLRSFTGSSGSLAPADQV